MKFMVRLGKDHRPAVEFFYPDLGPMPPLVPGESATAPSPGKSTRGPRQGKRGRVGRSARAGDPLAPWKY